MSSSTNSPCAACKCLRRKCTPECVYAPYFPPDQPQKFACVHKVFGASNVAKILNELPTNQREDAVNSLAYEAEERLRDPVYGCVGLISILQHRLRQVQADLNNAKKELATYMGPQAMLPMYMPQQPYYGNPSSSNAMQHGAVPMMGIPTRPTHSGQLVIRDVQQQQHNQGLQQQQQIFEAQQLAAAAAAREQEMLRNYEQHQQQQEIARYNYEQHQHQQQPTSVTATGFHQINPANMSPSLALGTFDNTFQIQPQPEHHQHPMQAHLMLQPQHAHAQAQAQAQAQQQHQQTQQLQQQRSGSDEGRSVGPS